MAFDRTSVGVSMSAYCHPLSRATDVERFGGKAANLARVERFGYRVPATMVLERRALVDTVGAGTLLRPLELYLAAATRAEPPRMDAGYNEITEALHGPLPSTIRDEILTRSEQLLETAPCGVAVRSSAVYEDSSVASFAGVFESFVGVMDPEAVLESVKSCWCSGVSPRAVRYMQRMGIRVDACAMAVIIQAVVPADSAGVIYTCEPVSGNPWRFVLQATHGLAVDLLGGSGVGDMFHLDWETGACERSEVVDQRSALRATPAGLATVAGTDGPALSNVAVNRIARIARELDERFGRRLDVEWAVDATGVWVVQARPMTALPEFFPIELPAEAQQKSWRPALVVLPVRADHPPHFLTPLYAHYSESEMWYRYQPADIVLSGIWKDVVDVNGYRYCDPGEKPDFQSAYRYCDPSAQPNFKHYFDGPAGYEAWLSTGEQQYRPRWDGRRFELQALEDAARAGVAETWSAAELIPVMLDSMDCLWDLIAFGWSGPQGLGSMCDEALRSFLREHRIDVDTTDLLSGGSGSHTFQVTKGQQELGRAIHEPAVKQAFEQLPLQDIVPHLLTQASGSEFTIALESFCWRFGKTPPSWLSRPPFWSAGANDLQVISAIKRAWLGTSQDVVALAAASSDRRQRVEEDVRRRVPATTHGRLTRLIDWARYWGQALNDRHGLAAGALWERELIWQVGRRCCRENLLAEPGDVLLFRRADLERFVETNDGSRLKSLFEKRRRAYRRNARLVPPARIGKRSVGRAARQEPARATPSAADDIGTFSGRGFGGGVVTGRARIVDHLDRAVLESLTREDVLILPHELAFDHADWHSLMTMIRGVVSPGQPSHHLAQVARECGVPLVCHVTGDLTTIADAEVVRVGATVERRQKQLSEQYLIGRSTREVDGEAFWAAVIRPVVGQSVFERDRATVPVEHAQLQPSGVGRRACQLFEERPAARFNELTLVASHGRSRHVLVKEGLEMTNDRRAVGKLPQRQLTLSAEVQLLLRHPSLAHRRPHTVRVAAEVDDRRWPSGFLVALKIETRRRGLHVSRCARRFKHAVQAEPDERRGGGARRQEHRIEHFRVAHVADEIHVVRRPRSDEEHHSRIDVERPNGDESPVAFHRRQQELAAPERPPPCAQPVPCQIDRVGVALVNERIPLVGRHPRVIESIDDPRVQSSAVLTGDRMGGR